jgi:hypothetical protein
MDPNKLGSEDLEWLTVFHDRAKWRSFINMNINNWIP